MNALCGAANDKKVEQGEGVLPQVLDLIPLRSAKRAAKKLTQP